MPACSKVEVRVNSFLSQRHEFPEPGAPAIHVFAETGPRNELFEAEVATAIRHWLEDYGYRLATDADRRPDYVLACWFGTDSGTTYTDTETIRDPSYYRTTRHYTSWGEWVVSRTYVPGSVHHVPYSYTVFQRRVALYLYKGEVPTTSRATPDRSSLVWQATAESPGRRPDLRRTVPYLLVAAFEYWGEDSGREKRETIGRKDERIKRLRPNDVAADAIDP